MEMQVSEETIAAAAAWARQWGYGQVGREPDSVRASVLSHHTPLIGVDVSWVVSTHDDHVRAGGLFQIVKKYKNCHPRSPGRGVAERIGDGLGVVSFYGDIYSHDPRIIIRFGKWTPRARTTFERRQQLGDASDPVQTTLGLIDRRPATLLGSILGVRDV